MLNLVSSRNRGDSRPDAPWPCVYSSVLFIAPCVLHPPDWVWIVIRFVNTFRK